MTGMTQNKYQHSIPKGVGGLCDQFSLFFIGSSTSSSITSRYTSAPRYESDTASLPSDTSEDTDASSKYNDITTQIIVPEIIISKSHESKSSDNVGDSNLVNRSPPTKPTVDKNDKISPDKNDDAETTIVRVHHKDTSLLLGESLVACINNMPIRNVDEELRRHNCSITGSIDSRRNRLIMFISTELGKLSSTTETNDKANLSNYLSGMERTMIGKFDLINTLTDEIVALKQEVSNLTLFKTKSNHEEKKEDSAEIKEVKDLWKNNLKAMKVLEGRMDAISNDVVRAEEQAFDAEEIVIKTKKELEGWHNSAFFHEDSLLLKDIHDYLISGKMDAVQGECFNCGKTASNNHPPISDELAADCVSPVSSLSQDTQPHPIPYPVPSHTHAKKLHLGKNQKRPLKNLSSSPSLSLSSPVNSVVGYHHSSHPTNKEGSPSRRSPGFNMTNSARKSTTSIPSASSASGIQAPKQLSLNNQGLSSVPSVEHHQIPFYQQPNIRSTVVSSAPYDYEVSYNSQKSTRQQYSEVFKSKPPARSPERPPAKSTVISPARPPASHNLRQTEVQQNSSQRNNGPSPNGKRRFSTVLITDSIMRRVPGDSLGINHILHVLNTRNVSGLADKNTRDTLRRINPDYVYIHLGINDVFAGNPVEYIVSSYWDFVLFLDTYLPNTKVIFSLPLPTDDRAECSIVKELRSKMFAFIDSCDSKSGIENRQIIYNSNSNLIDTSKESSDADTQIVQSNGYYSRDGIHLNYDGISAITANFRHAIHDISRRILNKPRPDQHQSQHHPLLD